MVLISVASSGGAGLELPLSLALGLREVALNPELVPLLGDQLRDGRDVGGHLEGAAEGLREGRQLRGQQAPDALWELLWLVVRQEELEREWVRELVAGVRLGC
jgi:hypothetical protein